MTALLIALIQALLGDKTLREKLIEYAKLDYVDDRFLDYLDEYVIGTFRDNPIYIPFWFLYQNQNIPAIAEEVLATHGNHTRVTAIYERHLSACRHAGMLDHQPEHRVAVLTAMNEGKDPDGWDHWSDVTDLYVRDFRSFEMLFYQGTKVLETEYHINKNKLREAAGLQKE